MTRLGAIGKCQRDSLKTSGRVTVTNTRRAASFTASCIMTPREHDILLARGLLAQTKSRQT